MLLHNLEYYLLYGKVTLAEVDVDQNQLRYERAQKMVEQGAHIRREL